jgi:hypothetical protein
VKQLYLALAFCACHPHPAAKMDNDIPDRVAGDCATPALLQLVAPPLASVEGRTTPLPTGYADAEKAFADATTRFTDHAFVAAARGFLAAAQLLEIGGPYADAFRHDRVIAYENAAIAYREAEALDEARRELAERARGDPACAADLDRIVQRLRTPGCAPAH